MTFNYQYQGYNTAVSTGSAVPDWQSLLPSHASAIDADSIKSPAAESSHLKLGSYPQDFPNGNYVKRELKTNYPIHENTSHIPIATHHQGNTSHANEHGFHVYTDNPKDASTGYHFSRNEFANMGNCDQVQPSTVETDYHGNMSTSVAYEDHITNMSMDDHDDYHGNTVDKVPQGECPDGSASEIPIHGFEETVTFLYHSKTNDHNQGAWDDDIHGITEIEDKSCCDPSGMARDSNKLSAPDTLSAGEHNQGEGLLNQLHQESLEQLTQHSSIRIKPPADTTSKTKCRTKRKNSVKLKLKLKTEDIPTYRQQTCEYDIKSEECDDSNKSQKKYDGEVCEETEALLIEAPENEKEINEPVKQERPEANELQSAASGKEKFPCESLGCERVFKSAAAMGRHMYREHLSKETKFVCYFSGCGKSFTQRKCLNLHKMSHRNERPFLCSICGQTFKTKNCLKNHDIAHVTERNFPCGFPGCEKAFKSLLQMKSHQQRHEKRPSTERFPCPVDHCHKTYKTKYNLMDHLKIHEAEKNNLPFTCASCGSGYRTQRHLNRHKLRSHAEVRKMYTCTYEGCSKTYRDKSYLKVHTRSHTLDYGCFLCNEPCCGKTFRCLDALTRHKRKVHPENRNFVCKTCGKSFKTKTTLQVHESTHTDVRPYKCSYDGCSKEFRTRSNCKMHEFIHTGEKPFQCNICGECFRSNIAVDTHRLEHCGPVLTVAHDIEEANTEAKQGRSQTHPAD